MIERINNHDEVYIKEIVNLGDVTIRILVIKDTGVTSNEKEQCSLIMQAKGHDETINIMSEETSKIELILAQIDGFAVGINSPDPVWTSKSFKESMKKYGYTKLDQKIKYNIPDEELFKGEEE